MLEELEEMYETNQEYQNFVDISFNWKKKYNKRILKYWNSVEDLFDIIYTCLDTASAWTGFDSKKNEITTWLIDNKAAFSEKRISIQNDTPIFIDKKPRSAISKFAHIVNPNLYPYIYDGYFNEYVRTMLERGCKKNIYENWDETINNWAQSHQEFIGNTTEKIWRIDSLIWAYGKYTTLSL